VQAEVVDIDQTALAGKVLTGDLQARLERRLRDAHVRVLGDDDQQSTGLAPSLTLDLTPVRVNAGEQQLGWAVYIEVSVSQYVSLIRPKPASGAVVLATTWNSGRIAVLKDDETFLDRLLEKVDAECDIFINAWQATHPTRSPRQP
jgi:hypothetical protein